MSTLKRKESDDALPPASSSSAEAAGGGSGLQSKPKKKVRICESSVFGDLDDLDGSQTAQSNRTTAHTPPGSHSGLKSVLRQSDQNITGTGWAKPSGCSSSGNGHIADDDEGTEDLEPFKRRRGAVRSDAYESDDDVIDSDDDEDDDGDGTKVREDVLKFGKPQPRNDDGRADDAVDDEDMFGDGFDTKPLAAKTNEAKPFLKSSQIDGQEWRGDFDDIIDDNGEVKIEPFNMDRELEEGPGLQRLRKWKKRQTADDAVFDADVNIVWREALQYMQPRETLIKTLQRIGPVTKRKTGTGGSKHTDTDTKTAPTPEMLLKRKQDLERITTIGSHLFDIDQSAYEKSYEQIVRLLRSKDLIDDDWVHGTPLPPLVDASAGNPLMYEYKWGDSGTEVFGPFTAAQMLAWSQCGLLAQGNAYVRVIGEANGVFQPALELNLTDICR
ncbi:hypothetical protein BASA84_000591 [Batrachochytrium salamandrivorans]|nr:hypothetical protein BASA84_000591 [Batrachochytrium salamandrivorans]